MTALKEKLDGQKHTSGNLNKKEKEENREVIVKYSPSKVISKDE